MSARIYLHAGTKIDMAGPVRFDPPVQVTRSGFYVLNLEGDKPTLEEVPEPWWVRLENGIETLSMTGTDSGEVVSLEDADPERVWVNLQELRELVREVRGG